MGNVIGVDIGGTNIKSALISPEGGIIKRYETETGAKKGAKEIINRIFSSVEKVKEEEISGIGIGSPGPLDYKNGVILNPVNLPLRNVQLKKIVQNKFHSQVFIDNDAKCFTLGEAIFGQGKKHENVVGITLGTGFGCGLAVNKKIYHGRNNATEFGHVTMKYDGLKSKSNNTGSIEEYISIRGLMNLFDKKTMPKDMQNLASRGNKNALAAYNKFGAYLGIALSNIAYAFDPEIIIIGGGISNSWDFFSGTMQKEARKRYFGKLPKIAKSELKDAGILGAAALVLKQRNSANHW